MAGPALTYLSEAERKFVHEQAVRVLEEIGIGYNTPEAIDLLAEAGAAGRPRPRLTASLPWELVERCLATCPSEVRLAGAPRGSDVVVGDGSLTFCADGTGDLHATTTSRAGGARAPPSGCADACASTTRCLRWTTPGRPSRPATSIRSPPASRSRPSRSRHFSKHLQDEVRDLAHVTPLLEIFEAVAGGSLWDRPIFSTINCTIAPLQHEREMTEATMAMVTRRRARCSCCPCRSPARRGR